MKTFVKEAVRHNFILYKTIRCGYRFFSGYYFHSFIKFFRVLKYIYYTHDIKTLTDYHKRHQIFDLYKDYNFDVLIETGTFLGETTEFFAPHFKNIYTIEVSEVLYEKAKERLKWYPNIDVIHGDSGTVLASLLNEINEPCVIYLDGHYSGGVN